MIEFIKKFTIAAVSQTILCTGTALTVGYALSGPVTAAPPAGADPAYSDWYHGLMVPQNGTSSAGGSCCSVADCRPVQYRMAGDHYEAFISSKTFGSAAPDKWVSVPANSVIKREANPTGEGVLCLFQGEVRCFVPASGT